jgi:hypothetical protein
MLPPTERVNARKYNDSETIKHEIREAVNDSSLFFRFLTGKRIYIASHFYWRNIEKNIVERENYSEPQDDTDSFYYATIREYSWLIYRRKHTNTVKKPSRLLGILSREKKRIRMATAFLMPAILKSFPFLFELSMNYYWNFSPELDFTTLFIMKAGNTGVDDDACRRFFIEVVHSVEPLGSWTRRMRALSYELYGNSMAYMDQFALYIAYALYKKSHFNISTALRSAYYNSPFKVCSIIMENREDIEKYLWIQE